MRSLLHKVRKSLFVGVCAVALSTISIQASDIVSGVKGRLTGAVVMHSGPCGEHEVLVRYGVYAVCMDVYEASPDPTCPREVTTKMSESAENIEAPECVPSTAPDRAPWRFVSFTQAAQLCARVGKRLPTAEEWYRVAIGQTDTSRCVLQSDEPHRSGSAGCVTPVGVHDMVGNVWEWMGDTTVDGQYGGRYLPKAGYVELVDDDGIVLRTADQAVAAFGEDYAWTHQEGVRGILRGGFYKSGSDGGVFSQNMSVTLDFATAGVGFRCVKDVQ